MVVYLMTESAGATTTVVANGKDGCDATTLSKVRGRNFIECVIVMSVSGVGQQPRRHGPWTQNAIDQVVRKTKCERYNAGRN